jgi:predicted enzyme related to lactoylglutathione lyase
VTGTVRRPPARLELVLDCHDPDALAEFWAAALGYRRQADAANYRSLVPVEGDGPRLILQGVAEPKLAKNRMHLDVMATDIEAEAARLTELGASRTRAAPVEEHGTRWIVMADPEGNEFCICQGGDLCG